MSFGWDLPPGVSQKMIDDYFGGADICHPCEDGDHDCCSGRGCECEDCLELAAEAAQESRDEERRLARRYGEDY